MRPCFNIPTTAGLLQHKGLDWAYYGARGGELGYGWVAVDQIKYIRDTDSWEKHVFPIEWFTHDVSQGYLAPVTWIAPPFNLSDHPGGPSLCQGENWTVGIVNAIMRSPLWESTAIVLIVGRLRRVLRPRPAAARRTSWASGRGCRSS